MALQTRPNQNEVSTHLFLSSFSLSSFSITITPSRCVVASVRDLEYKSLLEIANAVRGRQPRVSLVVAVIGRALEPSIFVLTMSVAGHSRREQEYGYLSYYHHIVLGLEEVDS
jgi:hypothetical protein